MRRLFIIRKDLNLSAGKLAAMIAHCSEAYWMNLLKSSLIKDNEFVVLPADIPYKHPRVYEAAKKALDEGKKTFVYPAENPRKTLTITTEIPKDIWTDYVMSIFTKTICEAKNLNQLMKVVDVATENGLVEGLDYGFIDDCCLTELTPEFTDENGVGRVRVGVWFKPLPDDVSKLLSKKYQLYKG